MLTPKVMSKAISIPGSLVVIGALIGGTLLGLLGALIAIPVTASILLIIKQVFYRARTRRSSLRWLAEPILAGRTRAFRRTRTHGLASEVWVRGRR